VALAYTLSDVSGQGKHKQVLGSFTSAGGDTTISLAPSLHDLNSIVDFNVKLSSSIGVQNPSEANSSGTITAIFDDTLGRSGTFRLLGN